MKLSQLETPALIVKEDILLKNAAAMKTLLEGTTLSLRPHFKSHKCAALAHQQILDGAIGMTCAKLSEAEDLADSGVEDILIANQIVEPAKIRRLANLAERCKLTVCVDDSENVAALASAAKNAGTMILCYVEYDIGMERCGVTEKEQVLALIRQIQSEENLLFTGIQAYAGHISHVEDVHQRKEMTQKNYEKLKALLQYLKDNGIAVPAVSGGSTGTAQIKAMEGLYTELQAGSYLFMDATYRQLGLPFENSLFVLSTVVSKRGELVVVDSGVKTCGVDQGMPTVQGCQPDHIVASEEHFQLHGVKESVNIGDKLLLIPGHCCSTVNLHDRIYIVRGDQVVDRIPVTGRGYGK